MELRPTDFDIEERHELEETRVAVAMTDFSLKLDLPSSAIDRAVMLLVERYRSNQSRPRSAS